MPTIFSTTCNFFPATVGSIWKQSSETCCDSPPFIVEKSYPGHITGNLTDFAMGGMMDTAQSIQRFFSHADQIDVRVSTWYSTDVHGGSARPRVQTERLYRLPVRLLSEIV